MAAFRRALVAALGLVTASLAGSASAQEGSGRRIDRAALFAEILNHVRKVDAHSADLKVPDFAPGKEWYNSAPLSFARELRGKVTVLDFWTYCCINCIHVLPDLAALEAKYAGFPVAFVGVHSAKFDNEKDAENVLAAVLRYEIEHPVVNDDEMRLWRGLGVRSWPTLVVVGPNGNLLLMVNGEGNREVIDACIAAALKHYPAEAFRHEPLPLRPERERRRSSSPLEFPAKLAIDPVKQRMYVSDSNHHRIVVTDLAGKFVDVAGSGTAGLADGAFSAARFRRPQGLALDGQRLYVADAENHALRLVDLETRTVATVAGTGQQGRDYLGGKRGREQELSTPWDVVVQGGKVIIAMAGSHQLWTFDPLTGEAKRLSGDGSEQNLNSQSIKEVAWAQPSGLSIGDGELFVADSESSAVRAFDLATGAARLVAGGDGSEPRNLFAFGDVDGEGDAARFQHPLGVLWLPRERRVAVADTYNHRIKLVDPRTKRAEAWVGSGKPGAADGVGLEAQFAEPAGLALGPDGSEVYVADANNHAVRVIDVAARRVRTLVFSGVPAAAPAREARRQRIADLPGAAVVRAPLLRLMPDGSGLLRLTVKLPAGHHLSPGAPSRWQVLDEEGSAVAVPVDKASGALVAGKEVEVPLGLRQGASSAVARIEALVYYCGENGICKVAGVLIEAPLEAGAAGATGEAKFAHVVADESPRFDRLFDAAVSD